MDMEYKLNDLLCLFATFLVCGRGCHCFADVTAIFDHEEFTLQDEEFALSIALHGRTVSVFMHSDTGPFLFLFCCESLLGVQ